MGCDSNAACRSCKVRFALGYGSYGSAERRKGRFPSDEHVGHDVVFWIDDYEWGVADNVLWGIGGYGERGWPILTDLDQYTKVDLSDVPLKE